jgi:hypothetical protein
MSVPFATAFVARRTGAAQAQDRVGAAERSGV